ncbi:SRPBCC family protein [Geomonas ferrireducens]|uniref:SRPBCC family protein n=1 Tax=Geomonas ferrireducens TaxID=2570227 RepID=UPI0010A8ACCE|nr:SRPBCC family protein [Geomonas ferrireducens]
MKPVTLETPLQTSFDRVAPLLTDFSLYSQWNPVFPRVTPLGDDGRHDLVVHLPGMEIFHVTASLVTAEPGHVSWKSRLFFSGLLAWTFSCRIAVEAPDRLLFQQRSEFTGLLAPLFCLALNRPAASGLDELSRAVRRWGEKGNVRCLKC